MTDDPNKKPKDKTVFGLPGSPPTGGPGDMKQASPKKNEQPPQDSPFVVNPQRRSSYPPPKFAGPSSSIGSKPIPTVAAKPPAEVTPGQPGYEAKKTPAKTILGMPVMSPLGKPGHQPGASAPAPVPAPAAAAAQQAKPAAQVSVPYAQPVTPKPVADGTFRTMPKAAPAAQPQPSPVQKPEKEGFAPTMMAYIPGPIPGQQPGQAAPAGQPPQAAPQPGQPAPQPQVPQEIGEIGQSITAGQPQKPPAQEPQYQVIGQPPGGAPPPGAPGAPGGAYPPGVGAPPPGAPGAPGAPPPGAPGAPPAGVQPGAFPPGGAVPPAKKKKSPLIYVGIGCGALLLIAIFISVIMFACHFCATCAGESTLNYGESLIESQLEEIEKQCDKQIETIRNDPDIPEDQKEQSIKLIEEGCEQSIEEARKALGM